MFSKKINLRSIFWYFGIPILFGLFFLLGASFVNSNIKLSRKFSVAVSVFGFQNPDLESSSTESEGTNESSIQESANSKAQTIAVFLRSGAVSEKILSLADAKKFCTPKEKFFISESAQFSSSVTVTFSCSNEISEKKLLEIQTSLEKVLNEKLSEKWSSNKTIWKIDVLEPADVTIKISEEIILSLAFLSGILMGIFVSVVFEKKEI